MITRDAIRATGIYLLEVLKTEKAVNYGRFFDENSPQTYVSLLHEVRPFLGDGDDEEEMQHHCRNVQAMLTSAAWQLEDLGILTIGPLEVDGDPDFEIALTEKGVQVVRDGLDFGFRDADYTIAVGPASEWLVTFLQSGDGRTLTLREVMEFAASEAEVVITDDYKNEYRLGTGSFAWAFEICLWHHVNRGVIIPACESPEHDKIWSDFVAQAEVSIRPSPCGTHPLWDIPFRLSELAPGTTINHVGTIRTKASRERC